MSPAAPAAPLSGPALGEAAAGTAGDGRCNGLLPGRPSRISGPELRGQAAGSGGGVHNGPPVPLPPRCGAVPPPLLPGCTDSEDGNHIARAAACGNAGNGNPLGNNDAAAAAIIGEADDGGQENDDCGGEDEDDNENNDKWGRGA